MKEQEARLKETEDEHSSDLENSLIRLEEEQQRCDSFGLVELAIRQFIVRVMGHVFFFFFFLGGGGEGSHKFENENTWKDILHVFYNQFSL